MGSGLKLTQLTKAQKARLPEIRDAWLAVGLSTEPANREEAEKGVDEAYRIAGLEPPQTKIWLKSPLEIAVATCQASVGDSVRASVWDSVRASVWDSVRASVWDSVWDSVRASVGASVRDSVRASVWDSVRASVGDSVGDSVWASVIYGQHDAGWLSHYSAFEEFGIEDAKKIKGLAIVAKNAGWWAPYKDVCLLSERPNLLKRDDKGRLHSLDSKAFEYPDGCGAYAIHGVRVPEKVVTQPDSLTVQEIREQSNAEVRRVMMERFGHARYLQESGAKLLQEDNFGKLWRTEIENDEPLVMVEVVNSTPEPDKTFKHYWLRVPPDVTTAREGIAWTFDVKCKDYRPTIET